MFVVHKQELDVVIRLVEQILHHGLNSKGIIISGILQTYFIFFTGETGIGKSFLSSMAAKHLNMATQHVPMYHAIYNFDESVRNTYKGTPVLVHIEEIEAKESAMGYALHLTPKQVETFVANIKSLDSSKIVIIGSVNVEFEKIPVEFLQPLNQIVALHHEMDTIDIYDMLKHAFASIPHQFNVYRLAKQLSSCKYAHLVQLAIREICSELVRRLIREEVDVIHGQDYPVLEQDVQTFLAHHKPYLCMPTYCTGKTRVSIAWHRIYVRFAYPKDVRFHF